MTICIIGGYIPVVVAGFPTVFRGIDPIFTESNYCIHKNCAKMGLRWKGEWVSGEEERAKSEGHRA